MQNFVCALPIPGFLHFFAFQKKPTFLELQLQGTLLILKVSSVAIELKYLYLQEIVRPHSFFANDSLTKVLMKLGSESPIFIYNEVQIGSIIQ